jgi:hypothetical protein
MLIATTNRTGRQRALAFMLKRGAALLPLLFLVCVCLSQIIDNGLWLAPTSSATAHEGARALRQGGASPGLSSLSVLPASPPAWLAAPSINERIHSFAQGGEELPQKLIFGPFANESAYPFISSDIWADLVDNRRTFFVRDREPGFSGYGPLREWIASRPDPITLVINNSNDLPWPSPKSRGGDWRAVLREPKLRALFVGGLRELSDEFRSKVKPLPLGPKWQLRSKKLFGEAKGPLKSMYASVSDSPQRSKELFESSARTNTVWVRPMSQSNMNTGNYNKSNPALSTLRSDVARILRASAPNATVVHDSFLDASVYLEGLQRHRFLANPAGNGLDTHSTWEALLAGCIPINPHSPLDPMYENLPVWLVDSWDEVTDEAVRDKAIEMSAWVYDWSLAFAEGWKKKIHEGLG